LRTTEFDDTTVGQNQKERGKVRERWGKEGEVDGGGGRSKGK
jgi:hypothetical protein